MDGTTRYIDLHFKFTFTFTFCFDGFMKKRQFGKKKFRIYLFIRGKSITFVDAMKNNFHGTT